MSRFKTSATKDYGKPIGAKNVHGGGKKPRKLKKIWRQHNQKYKKPFYTKHWKETIKDRIIRDIKDYFEQEEDYYKPVIVSNFCSNNYIEYENNSEGNKTLSIKETLDEIKPYLKDIINNLKKIRNLDNSINNSN